MSIIWIRYRQLLGWTALACLIAGGNGAVHNQVSYTVSPDYFHAFKFEQFQFPASLRHRGGASLVGFLASWWTGLAIGPALFLTHHRRLKTTPSAGMMLDGFAITLGVTAFVGACSLALGSAIIGPDTVDFAPQAARDPVAFARAGLLHDGSYLGGVLGTITACLCGWRRQAVKAP